MRDCNTLSEDWKAYLDGELPLSARLAMRLHLMRCAACREEITAMENISRELRTADAGELAPDLRARLVAAIPTDLPKTDAPAMVKPKATQNRPLLLFGATAIAAVCWFVAYPVLNTPHAFQRADSKKETFASGGSSAATSSEMPMAAGNAALPRMSAPGSPANLQSQTDSEDQSVWHDTNAGGNRPMPAAPPTAGMEDGKDKFAQTLQANETEQRRHMMKSMPAPDGVSGNIGGGSFGGTRNSGGSFGSGGRGAAGFGGKSENAPARQSVAVATEGKKKAYVDKPSAKFPYDNGATVLMGSVREDEITRQVHREADLTVVVDNPEIKSDSVEEMVKIAGGGGYVATNQLTTEDDGRKVATLTVKIPVAQFDSFLTKVSRLGEVKSKNVNGEDLTEQISDSKQAVRVLTGEIKQTQQRLDRPRNRTQSRLDAESMRELKIKNAQQKARLEMLTRMATLATINITLEQKPKVIPQAPPQTGGFLQELRDTANTAGQTFMQAAKLPFVLLVWVIVYAPLWLLLVAAYRYFART